MKEFSRGLKFVLAFAVGAAVAIVLSNIAGAQMIKYHIADGNFYGVTQAQSQSRIIDGLNELQNVTDRLRFVRVGEARKAKLRISFGTPDRRATVICGGRVSISRNRKEVIISKSTDAFVGQFNHNIETLAIHLGLNAARFRFSTYAKVQRVHRIPAYPSFYQMEQIRKKYRVPKNEVKFLPLNLVWVGAKHAHYVALHNANWAERRELLAIRDAASNAEEMRIAQDAVLVNYYRLVANKIPMGAAATEWHYVNSSWMGFTNYINNNGIDEDDDRNGGGDTGDHD
jgi:hypothetical protein